jgi:hypothetical protein
MARRKYDTATAEDWSTLLCLGYDFFGDLPQWPNATLHKAPKFSEEHYRRYPATERPKPENKEFLAAAREAWRLYGPRIMLRWKQATHRAGERQLPEAWHRFGDPAKL